MTRTKCERAKFASFFDCFYKYWNYTSKRGTEYTELEVTFQTSFIYMLLKMEWGVLGWDIEKLNWIFHALDNNYDILDLHNFTECKFAYIDHLKTCYYLDHNE